MTTGYCEHIAGKIPFWLLGLDTNDTIPEKDWDTIIKKLRLHGLIPFFVHYQGLKQHAPPLDVKAKLHRMAQAIIAKNMHKHNIQRELTEMITKAGIPFLFFKGLGLSQYLYQNPYLRPLIDIDLLVKPNNEQQIRNLLYSIGAEEEAGLQNTFVETLQKHGKPLKYKNVLVEIHTTLFKKMNGINEWGFVEENNKGGFTVFKPVFYLIYLCYHCFQHLHSGKTKLIWLIDIACLYNIIAVENKVSQIIKLSRQLNLEKETLSVLHLIHAQLGIEIQSIQSEFITKDKFNLNKQFNRILNDSQFKVPRTYYTTKFRGLSFKGSIRYMFSLLFPSPHFVQSRYGIRHTLLLVPFYIFNPFRILFKAIFWKSKA